MATKFEAFIASLRSEATRVTYESSIQKVLGKDPDAFLSMDPAKAKDLLVGYIIANRDRFTGATIANRLSNVKAFCDEYGHNVEWKIIRRKVPPVRYVGVDRAPTVEEVRKVLQWKQNPDSFLEELGETSKDLICKSVQEEFELET